MPTDKKAHGQSMHRRKTAIQPGGSSPWAREATATANGNELHGMKYGAIAFSDTGSNENPAIDGDPDTVAAGVAVVTGGTGAYDGARGTIEIDYESDKYKVNLELSSN